MLDEGHHAGAAHSDELFLQAVDILTVPQLPSEDQDLLPNGDRVHAVVFPACGVHTAVVAAFGLDDHLGEPVGILGEAVNQSTRMRRCLKYSPGTIQRMMS